MHNNFIKKINDLEDRFISRADALIIQDDIREELFLSSISLFTKNLKVYKIPVSPLPYSELKNDNYFQIMFICQIN